MATPDEILRAAQAAAKAAEEAKAAQAVPFRGGFNGNPTNAEPMRAGPAGQPPPIRPTVASPAEMMREAPQMQPPPQRGPIIPAAAPPVTPTAPAASVVPPSAPPVIPQAMAPKAMPPSAIPQQIPGGLPTWTAKPSVPPAAVPQVAPPIAAAPPAAAVPPVQAAAPAATPGQSWFNKPINTQPITNMAAKVAAAAPGKLSGVTSMAGKAAPVVGGAIEGARVFNDNTTPGMTGLDQTGRVAEGVGRFGSTMAGVAGGAKVGAMAGAMTGPAAPVAVPALALAGGVVGGLVGDKIPEWTNNIVNRFMGTDTQLPSQKAAQLQASQQPAAAPAGKPAPQVAAVPAAAAAAPAAAQNFKPTPQDMQRIMADAGRNGDGSPLTFNWIDPAVAATQEPGFGAVTEPQARRGSGGSPPYYSQAPGGLPTAAPAQMAGDTVKTLRPNVSSYDPRTGNMVADGFNHGIAGPALGYENEVPAAVYAANAAQPGGIGNYVGAVAQGANDAASPIEAKGREDIARQEVANIPAMADATNRATVAADEIQRRREAGEGGFVPGKSIKTKNVDGAETVETTPSIQYRKDKDGNYTAKTVKIEGDTEDAPKPIPSRASIAALKNAKTDPATIKQFEDRYGKGTAAQYLGK